MTITAPELVQQSQPTAAPAPVLEHATVAVDDREQLRAEAGLLRTALKGGAIGALLCAPIWVGLVALATVGKGVALAPLLAMAAGCGVFAGLFLGGCAGALAGSHALEQVEHDRMHRLRHDSAAS